MRVSGVRLRPVRRRLVCGSRRTSAPFKNRGRSLARPFRHHSAKVRARGASPEGRLSRWSRGPNFKLGMRPEIRRKGIARRPRPPSRSDPRKKLRGASRGGRGTLWDLTPGDAHGSAFEATRLDRLHGRIPQAGPCSTFRRSLFHSPAVPLPPCDAPSKHKPLGTCSALRGTFVARLANSASVGCTSLRAIDDSGAHRTRVSSCQGLLANPFRRLCTI